VHVVHAGQPHWEAAGVADKIDLRIAPATETLNAMLEVVHQPTEHALADISGHCSGHCTCAIMLLFSRFLLSVQEGKQGTVDLAFIDADKPSYGQYYELLLQLLRPGGVIAVQSWRRALSAFGCMPHTLVLLGAEVCNHAFPA
jgi:O-methyltransferase